MHTELTVRSTLFMVVLNYCCCCCCISTAIFFLLYWLTLLNFSTMLCSDGAVVVCMPSRGGSSRIFRGTSGVFTERVWYKPQGPSILLSGQIGPQTTICLSLQFTLCLGSNTQPYKSKPPCLNYDTFTFSFTSQVTCISLKQLTTAVYNLILWVFMFQQCKQCYRLTLLMHVTWWMVNSLQMKQISCKWCFSSSSCVFSSIYGSKERP